MGLWIAAVWGMLGGFCVEALELYALIKASPGHWSWRQPISQGPAAFWTSVGIRVGAGAAVAAAASGSHQVSGSLGALALGVGAPLVIERLARAVPLTSPESPSGVEANLGADAAADPATSITQGADSPLGREGDAGAAR